MGGTYIIYINFILKGNFKKGKKDKLRDKNDW